MSKKKITRLRRPTANKAPLPSDGSADREFSVDLEVELSKARAASILLKADTDYLQMPVNLTAGEEESIRAWIKGFAFDALDAALDEAEAARRKLMPREQDFAAGPGRKAVV